MLKKIGVCTLLGVSILLAACGGGGGDSNSSNSPTWTEDSLANGTKYYQLSDEFRLEYLEVQNKTLKYSNHGSALDSYLLTKNKLYTPDDIAEYSIELKSMTQWTYHVVGDVKINYELKSVNLSGKNVFDTLFPGVRQLSTSDRMTLDSRLHRLLLNHGDKKFPNGSTCYGYASSQHNQGVVVFDTDTPSTISFDWFAKNLYTLLGMFNPIFGYKGVHATWQNIPWVSIYDKVGNSLDEGSVVRYGNQEYVANYFPDDKRTKDNYISFAEELVADLKRQGDNVVEESLLQLQLELEQTKIGCDFYNQTAANLVAEAVR